MLLGGPLRFLRLGLRSSSASAAENLFLRKLLALYQGLHDYRGLQEQMPLDRATVGLVFDGARSVS